MRDSLNSNPDCLFCVDIGTTNDVHTVLHIQKIKIHLTLDHNNFRKKK